MIQPYITLLKSAGFIIQESREHLSIAYNTETHLIVSLIQTRTAKEWTCIIVKGDTSDTRFNGRVANTIELKSVLNMIKRNL